MSKLRKPWTFEDAIHVAVADLGLEGTAQAVGKSGSLVYKWGDPDIECLPSVRQAAQIDAAFIVAGRGEGPMLRAYQGQVQLAVDARGGAPEHVPGDPLARVVDLMRETSEAAEAYHRAVQPGKRLTSHEINETLREIAEAQEALEDVKRDVEAHAANGVVKMRGAAE